MTENNSAPAKNTTRKTKKAAAAKSAAMTREDGTRLEASLKKYVDERFSLAEKNRENGDMILLKAIHALEDKMDAKLEAVMQSLANIMNAIDRALIKEIPDLKTEKMMAVTRLDRHDKQLMTMSSGCDGWKLRRPRVR